MNEIAFPLIPTIFPIIVLNQAIVWLIKVYWINMKYIDIIAIITWYILTYIYIIAYNIHFNFFQIILIWLVNWLVSIWFYKTSKWKKNIDKLDKLDKK